MTLFRKVRKDAPTSEETHMARGVLGVIVIIALIIVALVKWFPPASTSASVKQASNPVASAKIRGPQ